MASKLDRFKKEIVASRKRGESYRTIGMRYGVSSEYVRQYLERKAPGVDVRHAPFLLSVLSGGMRRYFGAHATEEEAYSYFFNKVPLDPAIWGFSVYRKSVPKDRRLWHNVVLKGEKYERLGAPVYGLANLEDQRQVCLRSPLPRAADKIAVMLDLQPDSRPLLRQFKVVEEPPGVFVIDTRDRKDRSLEDQLLS